MRVLKAGFAAFIIVILAIGPAGRPHHRRRRSVRQGTASPRTSALHRRRPAGTVHHSVFPDPISAFCLDVADARCDGAWRLIHGNSPGMISHSSGTGGAIKTEERAAT
jgi:hypothetical protein